MKSCTPCTLVTGATGLIGRNLLVSLTARGRCVVAVVRRAAEREAELQDYVTRCGGDGALVRAVEGDLSEEGLGLGEEHNLSAVRDVFHCAGMYAFGATEAEAVAANVDGSLRALRWAHTRPQLRRVVVVGGYRMTKLPDWLGESRPRGAVRRRLYRRFGAYEGSKIEASLAVREVARELELPLTVVHPSAVIGRSDSGETNQVTGVGETFERLWLGQLPALAGNERTFVPVVTADELAELMATVVEHPETEGQEIVVHDPRTPALPGLVQLAATHLGVRAPKLQVPVSVVRALPKALTGLDSESLSFLCEDRYDDELASRHARRADVVRPDVNDALSSWLDYLVSSRFGRAREVRPGRFVEANTSRTFCVGDAHNAPTVLLHGLPWDGESWRGVEAQLEGVVARPDLPGLGRSSPVRGELPGPNHGWLSALLGAESHRRVLVGHSLGCEAALHWAEEHPERVASLVLVSPFFLQARAPWPLRVPWLAGPALRRMGVEELGRRLLPGVELEGEVREALESTASALSRPGVSARLAKALSRASSPAVRDDLQSRLARVAKRARVVVVHGDGDPLQVTPEGATVQAVLGAGHHLHLTHPWEVAAAAKVTPERSSARIARHWERKRPDRGDYWR